MTQPFVVSLTRRPSLLLNPDPSDCAWRTMEGDASRSEGVELLFGLEWGPKLLRVVYSIARLSLSSLWDWPLGRCRGLF